MDDVKHDSESLERSSLPEEGAVVSVTPLAATKPPTQPTSPTPAKPTRPRRIHPFAWLLTILCLVVIGFEISSLNVINSSAPDMIPLGLVLGLLAGQTLVAPVLGFFGLVGLLVSLFRQDMRGILHHAINIALVLTMYLVL